MSMWPRNAYVGQHVVCTVAKWVRYGKPFPSDQSPKKGIVYTIAAIKVYEDKVFFRLEGFPTTDFFYFAAFRPVDDSRLDIFRQILQPKPTRKPVNA